MNCTNHSFFININKIIKLAYIDHIDSISATLFLYDLDGDAVYTSI